MKDETIKILENGIFIYNGKLLLYCVKNEKIEDDFISDIKCIKSIPHKEYDPDLDNSKEKIDLKPTDYKDNRSFNSNSKYESDNMTGIKR